MPKKSASPLKAHITGTVDPRCVTAMKSYRDDPKNLINDEKPSKSYIMQRALETFLKVYLPKSFMPIEKL